MNNYQETGFHEAPHRTTAKVAAGTSFVEGIVGLASIALAVIGLAGVFPMTLLSISTIALGAALLFEAGAVAARFSTLMDYEKQAHEKEVTYQASRWGGMTTGFLAGIAGIALGILALLGIYPMVLIPVAAIAFGTALIMDSGVNARLDTLESEQSGLGGLSRQVASESSTTATGIEVLVGLGSITLGILALVGYAPVMLSLVAMLSVGAAVLICGSVIGGRMVSMFRRA